VEDGPPFSGAIAACDRGWRHVRNRGSGDFAPRQQARLWPQTNQNPTLCMAQEFTIRLQRCSGFRTMAYRLKTLMTAC